MSFNIEEDRMFVQRLPITERTGTARILRLFVEYGATVETR